MSDDEDNQSQNSNNNNRNNGAQLLNQLATIFQTQNQLLENSNPAQFEYKFPGKHQETLPWIFAAEKFIRVNSFTTEKIKFQRIFSSLNDHYQNRYLMDTMNEDNITTFDSLKSWVLKEYPPPKTKIEFKSSLSSMLMRRNEDPSLAYSRYKYKLSLINKAIDTINKGIWDETCELFPNDDDEEDAEAHYYQTMISQISDEDKHEALINMFVIKNNKAKWNNDGNINALVYKYIIKKDPNTMDNWDLCFQSMKRELIPRILDGNKDYEFQAHPLDPNDDNIYASRLIERSQPASSANVPLPPSKDQQTKSSTDAEGVTNHRKRIRTEQEDNDQQPTAKKRKLGRKKRCHRCQRIGHIAADCWASLDKYHQPITSPAPMQLEPCVYCKKTNHPSSRCNYKDDTNNEKDQKAWRQYGHQKADEAPSKKQSKFNKTKEINALKTSFELSQDDGVSTQNDAFSIINTFRQWVSNNNNIDDAQAEQFEMFALDMTKQLQSQ